MKMILLKGNHLFFLNKNSIRQTHVKGMMILLVRCFTGIDPIRVDINRLRQIVDGGSVLLETSPALNSGR